MSQCMNSQSETKMQHPMCAKDVFAAHKTNELSALSVVLKEIRVRFVLMPGLTFDVARRPFPRHL